MGNDANLHLSRSPEEAPVRIDLYASRPHYASHMLPVYRALPKALRGQLTGPRLTDWWVEAQPDPDPHGAVTMVAGYCDLQARAGRGPFVYVEHGAGQTYPGDPYSADDPSYSGGLGHNEVALYVCPSETVAARWRKAYQGTPAVVVGCPVLDPWHNNVRPYEAQWQPTVALAFHWDCGLIPETRSAFRHYEAAIGLCVAAWRAQGFQVVGHSHPRISDALTPVWAEHGVQVVPLGWVYDHADVLAADNTSIMYEFASLGRDVVCLNAPWYRRDVDHGLRFWSHMPGLPVDTAAELEATVTALLSGDQSTLDRSRAMRDRAVDEAYAHRDGLAAWRAAQAITKLVEGRQWPNQKSSLVHR